ncbi:ABC transporter permease subunit [Spiribacter halobius]|uniref:Branched-chain amino acid permease/ABC transporter ATP-binding protein n=1 Tax=Sediminicurvatus halobius TaxID=2182432 RepID=A0A2U2N9L2_9GAMM|nr:ATP-binding cassette domain-containing protein [Spiribacter halobius]PWG65788.1 branched-chain amino acid permease/ABC transporter ATP-binding protein [Spiribacter halobius]UEX77829.1 ATP-binding cassette domain-containing protein [Spiribacter halobius]
MENSESITTPSPLALAGRSAWWALPTAVAGVVALLAMNADEYAIYIATSWLAFGLVALGLDLVWGKGGDLSLGHTVFFGLGAYVYGIAGSNLGPLLGSTALIGLLSGAAIGALAAAGVAYFLFYGRLGALQTTIITYTLVLIMYTVAVGWTFELGEARVGGANGMTTVPMLTLGFGPDAAPASTAGAFYFALAVALLIFLGVKALLRRPFGLVISGVRQNLLKTELLGYDVRRYRLVLFTISGAIAGIGGALYGAWALYVSPNVFSVAQALLIPIYVLVGGRGTLWGAFVGAVFVGGLSFWLGGGVVGGQTALVLGGGLIALVLLAPRGLLGMLRRRRQRSAQAGSVPADRAELGGVDALFDRQSTGAVVLETQDLQKRFGGVTATDHVSMQFHDRGIHCLIGPNGAGKSTFLGTCLGLLKPDGGQVLFEGAEITGWAPYRRVQAGLGIKLQVARILEELSVRENLWLAAYSRHEDPDTASERVRRTLSVIGLTHRAHEPGGALSHGEQQWLDLGMVLCLEPKLIFLDEPAAGMTGQERQHTVALLKRISRFAGVVVVEHDMDFIRDLDAPVTVLHQGAVFASGTIDELRQDERVLDIYLGRQSDA